MTFPSQKELLRQEYVSRINKAMDFIEQHVDEELNVARIAEAAHFSPFHFSRIFSAITGETVNGFLKRYRVEKAASMLMIHPKESITEIAELCGFSGLASFSRAFKNIIGMSPSAYRDGGWREHSKIRKPKRIFGKKPGTDGDAPPDEEDYISGVSNFSTKIWSEDMDLNVEIREMEDLHVAYARHTGNYSLIGRAFDKLFKWAGPRGLFNPMTSKVLAVYHDSPGITEEDKLRSSACLTVPEGTSVDGEIGTMTVEGGKFACARFEIDETQFTEAWESVYSKWLPQSGYQPDDKYPYELYHNDHTKHPEKKFIVDICVPVKPL